MSEPTTKAGRELLRRTPEDGAPGVPPEILRADILAIEAEARAVTLAEVRREVEALPTSATVWTGDPLVYRAAVLSVLDRLEKGDSE
jgi:hypothetical protein